MLLPTRCPICLHPGPAPCAACIAKLRRAPNLPPPAHVDVMHALLAYDGGGRELVARLKYRNARASVPWLGAHLAALVRLAGTTVDIVTWVPTTVERRHARGFDQAELLARAVARPLRLPCRSLLDHRPGPAQTGRSAAERRTGPRVTARRAPAPQRVLVVDDVLTTGATAAAAAGALRAAGAQFVAVAVAARTPLRRTRQEYPATL